MKPSQLILLLNDAESTVGTTEDWCKQNDINYKILVGKNLPELTEDSLPENLIIFGGGMQVWETQQYPWLISEKKWVKSILNKGGRIFGVCLGAQILAEQLGGVVVPMCQWEIGWYPIQFNLCGATLEPLHWHESRCEFSNVSGDVKVIAHNETAIQGFELSPRVIGYQFHTEIDPKRLEHAMKSWTPTSQGRIQSPEKIKELAKTHIEPLRSWYFEQLNRWWSA